MFLDCRRHWSGSSSDIVITIDGTNNLELIRIALFWNGTEFVLRASNDLELFNRLSYKLLQSVQSHQSFDGNPLYAILHEPVYCQGFVISCPLFLLLIFFLVSAVEHPSGLLLVASRTFHNFHGNTSRRYQILNQYTSQAKWYLRTSCDIDSIQSCLSLCPQIFPEMFDDFSNLRPLKGAAEILAKDTSWCQLYDLDRLAKNDVKVSAVTWASVCS